MRQDLTKKMKANLERFRDNPQPGGTLQVILHVGAAEHLVSRGLIVKTSGGGYGRAKAAYETTIAGRAALAKL